MVPTETFGGEEAYEPAGTKNAEQWEVLVSSLHENQHVAMWLSFCHSVGCSRYTHRLSADHGYGLTASSFSFHNPNHLCTNDSQSQCEMLGPVCVGMQPEEIDYPQNRVSPPAFSGQLLSG